MVLVSPPYGVPIVEAHAHNIPASERVYLLSRGHTHQTRPVNVTLRQRSCWRSKPARRSTARLDPAAEKNWRCKRQKKGAGARLASLRRSTRTTPVLIVHPML